MVYIQDVFKSVCYAFTLYYSLLLLNPALHTLQPDSSSYLCLYFWFLCWCLQSYMDTLKIAFSKNSLCPSLSLTPGNNSCCWNYTESDKLNICSIHPTGWAYNIQLIKSLLCLLMFMSLETQEETNAVRVDNCSMWTNYTGVWFVNPLEFLTFLQNTVYF